MGGSAHAWHTTLPADVIPGSPIQLRLVMTKFGLPDVRIAYAISLQTIS